jgi:hypothetical protein
MSINAKLACEGTFMDAAQIQARTQELRTPQDTKKAQRRRRREHGTGNIRLKGKGWHLQYRDPDGKLRSVKLCNRDDVHHSPTCPAVKDLAAKKLIELQPKEGVKADMKVADFWENVFLR